MSYTYESVVADVITTWAEKNGKDVSAAEAAALAAEIRKAFL